MPQSLHKKHMELKTLNIPGFFFCLCSLQYVYRFRVWSKRHMTGDKMAPFNSIASVGLAEAHPSDLSLLCLSNCSCTISRAVTEKSDTSTVPKGRAESPFGIVCPRTNNSLSRGVPGIKSWRNVENRKRKTDKNSLTKWHRYLTEIYNANFKFQQNVIRD